MTSQQPSNGSTTGQPAPTPADPPSDSPSDPTSTAPAGFGKPARPHRSFAGGLLPTGIVLLAIAAIIVVLLPQWLVSPTGIRQAILRSLPDIHGDVEVDAASIGWFTPLAIDGIRLVPATDGEPPLSIATIRGERSMLDILRNGGRLGEVTVSGLAFDLVFDEQHVTNLQRTVGKPPARAASGAIPSQPPTSQPLDTTGDQRVQIKVADARIRIKGPWSEAAWESQPINVEATLRRTAAGVREWSLTPLTLLDHARLEPSVAAGVLAYAAPILADTTRTGGEFSLVIEEARWPAGHGEEATVAGTLTLHEVDVGPGPLVEGVVAAMPGRLPAPPTIRVAEASVIRFRQANRRVWHEGLAFGLPLPTPGQRLDIESNGSVGLDDRSVNLTLALPIPADLPKDRPLLAALAGKTLKAQVVGTLDAPQFKLDESLKETATAVAADVIESLRNNRKKPASADQPAPVTPSTGSADTTEPQETQPPPPNQQREGSPKQGNAAKLDQLRGFLPPEVSDDPATDTVIDAVGGLLDEVARRRAEKAAKATTEAGQPAKNSADPQDRPARRLLRKLISGDENKPAETDAAAGQPTQQEPADKSRDDNESGKKE